MPRTHIALIRGINVGRAKRVAMADLRALAAELGYEAPRTLLNSGNLVYVSRRDTTATAAARLEEGLRSRIGVAARVIVLAASELAEVIAENPLAAIAGDPSRLLVAVWPDAADRARLLDATRQDWGAERLALGARAAYLWCPPGITASRLSEAVGKALGERVTMRNWATMTKLHALSQE